MRNKNFLKILQDARSFGHEGLTLQRRLFVFFFLFLVAVMSALLLILFALGVFSAGLKENRIFLENELHHIAGSVEKDFGSIAVQGVSLSRRLTEQIERGFTENNLTPWNFRESPDHLESLLNNCFDTLNAALEQARVSAAFVVLDATVNPDLAGAETSRAGIFLKNMAPNVAYESPSAIRYMRGPTSIARERNMYLMPQWEMEFTIARDDFFYRAMKTAYNDGLELSRLYYWNPKAFLAGDYIEAMMLVVPMIAGDGTVVGVCGFEVSDMLFKMQYTPDNSAFSRIFSMLAPTDDKETFDASQALLAGSYTATSAGISGIFEIKMKKNGLSYFIGPNDSTYSGLYRAVNLYPKDAVHGSTQWILGVAMPQQDLSDYARARNTRILILLLTLFILSAAAASILSRKYISPVVNALEKIRQPSSSDYEKTNIQEIDDLLAFLAQQDKPDAQTSQRTEVRQEGSALFDAFIKNIETLSPAERSVFNLYLEGYNAREIAEILCLSINTIKTHNKRIYMKLDVSSRNELLLYVKMMKERNQ